MEVKEQIVRNGKYAILCELFIKKDKISTYILKHVKKTERRDR